MTCKMFTSLNETRFLAWPLAGPNVNTEDINRNQSMESMLPLPPPPATTPTHPSMARHHTFKFIWWWHTITIHRLFYSHNLILHWVGRCPYKVWPQWALEVNYCLRVETWPDNLSAAGSGLSKTTVSFPTHTRGTHSFCFTISISSSHLFADSLPFTITPCLCTFAPSFSSFSMTSASPPALSLSPLPFFPENSGLYPTGHSPRCGRPCQCRAVNSWGSWKHKHAQT